MPIVTATPRQMQNGQVVTQFIDSVGTSSVTYTYTETQEKLIVRNLGNEPITVTLGGANTVQPGESVEISAEFTSFAVVSTSGVQAFEAWADEDGSTFDSPEGQYFTSTSTDSGTATGLRLVATRGAHAAQGAAGRSNGTDTDITGRVKHVVPAPAYGFVFTYANARSKGDTFGDNAITIKVSLEKADGTIFPAFFNGSDTVTIKPGATVETDPIGTAVTQAEIDAGQGYIYSRTYVSVTAGQYFPVSIYTVQGDGEGKVTGDATTGAWSTTNSQYVFAPLAVKGKAQSPLPAIAIIGDSIMFGSGDNTIGFMQRALNDEFPFTKLAQSGEAAHEFKGLGHLARSRALDGVTHAVINYCTNDIGVYSRTYAQITADLTTISNALAARGIKVYLCTPLPRVSTSDSGATLENQSSAGVQYEPGGYLEQIAEWMRESPPASVTHVFDTRALVESSTGSCRWAVDQGALTGDGTHPNATGAAILAAGIDTTLFN